jgi:hypothetical protein
VIIAVRLRVLLSALAVLVGILLSIWLLITSPEWWLVILIEAVFFGVIALAVIWLGVFVAIVVRKAVRVINDANRR